MTLLESVESLSQVERSEFESALFSGQYGPAVVKRFTGLTVSESEVQTLKVQMAQGQTESQGRKDQRSALKTSQLSRKVANVGEEATVYVMATREYHTGVVTNVSKSKKITVKMADGSIQIGIIK